MTELLNTISYVYYLRLGPAVLNGLRAVAVLLKGSEPVLNNKKIFQDFRYIYIHEYKKLGDYSRTLEDFYSVRPRRVSTYELPGGVRYTLLCRTKKRAGRIISVLFVRHIAIYNVCSFVADITECLKLRFRRIFSALAYIHRSNSAFT